MTTDPALYAPPSVTRALLKQGRPAHLERLAAADMLSPTEVARLLGTPRATIDAWIHTGRALVLTRTKRSLRLPRWQFEPQLWEALPKVMAALGTRDGSAVLSFLESPLGSLGCRNPRQAIEQGHAELVIHCAGHDCS